MRIIISAAFAVAVLVSTSVIADESKPVQLSDTQMDLVTAAGLELPNGREIFPDFDNPAPFLFHPTFDRELGGGARSTTAAQFITFGPPPEGGGATQFKGPYNGVFGNEGPWTAHFASPVIGCIGC